MARENLDFYGVGKDILSVRSALVALRADFDAHNHDGTSSKVFQTLSAETVSSRVVLIRKTSFLDTAAGLWVGLVDNVPKFYLGSASDYFKFDQNGLSILLSTGSFSVTQLIGSLLFDSSGLRFRVGSTDNANILLSSGAGPVSSGVQLRFVVGGSSGGSGGQLDFTYTASNTANLSPSSGKSIELGTNSLPYQNIYCVNSLTVTSDIRLKSEVREIRYGLAEVLKLRPIQYKITKKEAIGFSAQDVAKLIPEIASDPENKEITASIRPMELIPVLVQAIKELNEKVEKLSTKLKANGID